MNRHRPTGKGSPPVGGITVAALVAATILVAGCATSTSTSVSSPTTPSPTIASPTTASPTTASPTTASPTTTSPAEPADTFAPSQTAIKPGTYCWDGFESSVSIAVGSGWALGHDNAAFFDLFRGSDFPSISFARFSDVYVDGTTRAAAVDAETVAATLTGRADVTVTGLAPIELGGRTGRQFDLATLQPPTPLFFGPAGDFKLDPEFKTRYRVLDFPGGGVLVVGIHTRDGGFDDGVTLAEPVVATLTIQS